MKVSSPKQETSDSAEKRRSVDPGGIGPPSATLGGMRTALALAVYAAAAPLLSSCITESVDAQGRPINASAPGRMRTRGVIVREPITETWFRVRGVLEGMTNEPLRPNGVPRSVRTTIMGAETTVLVEPFDAQRTIIHIRSEDSAVEERIRLDVLRGVTPGGFGR